MSVDAGELATKWISKGLKKSARNILKHSDDLEKHLDDLVKEKKITPKQKTEVLEKDHHPNYFYDTIMLLN